MKPICWAHYAPLQNAPFSLSIKLNDIFPLCALDAMSSTCGDAGRPQCHECVLSKTGGLRKAEANTEASELGSSPPCHFTEETAALKKKCQCLTSQGDIRFETWVFCFHMNSQAPSDRWGMEISHYERQISLLFWFRCIWWGTKRHVGFLRSIYKGTTHSKIALQSDWLTVNVLACP